MIALLLLAACHLGAGPGATETVPAVAAPSEQPAPEQPAPEPAQPAPEPASPEPVAAPAFDRHCAADADCAVVAACAGLDHIPADPPTESCGDACYVAIRAADVARWTAACAAVEAKVPCDLKRGKCASPAGRTARCQFRRCQVF